MSISPCDKVRVYIPYNEAEALHLECLTIYWGIQQAAGSPHVPAYFDYSPPKKTSVEAQ